MTLKICMFSSLYAEVDDVPIEIPGKAGAVKLLAYLALQKGQPIPVHRAASDLWPATSSEDSLRKAAENLRSIIGSERSRVYSVNGFIRLDCTGAKIDILEFDERIASKQRTTAAGGMDLFTGKLLTGFTESWVLQAQLQYTEKYRKLVEYLYEQAKQANRPEVQATVLRKALCILPEVQDWWESLIELQTRIGAHAEALSTFDQYRKYLAAVSAEHRVDIRPRCSSDRLIKMLRTPAQPIETPSLVHPRIFETVEGAVPAGSPYYVARHEDNAGKAAVAGSVSTLLIKGPGQTGKTSLLHRLLQDSGQQGAVIYRTAWRSVTASEIKDPAQFYTTQMRGLAKTFNLPPPANTQSHLSPEATFEQYLRDEILAAHNTRLIWAIDDADRLFDVDYREDFFGLLRALHNERSYDPQDPLQHLTIVLTYSTEAHLFIQDLNRSPFNVGVRVELSDFTRNQVTELNERYESPLNQDQLERAYSLLNGHPYLTRKLLYSVQVEKNDPEAMLNENPFASRIYLAHLEHLDRAVNGTSQAAQEVKAGLRAIIAGAGCTRQAEARILASGIL